MARTLVAVNPQGRVTLPAEVRRRLNIVGGSQLEVGVEGDRVTLRPTRILPAEDAWAYRPEEVAGIRRALEEVRAGRVYRVGIEELERILETGKIPAAMRRRRSSGTRAKQRKGA